MIYPPVETNKWQMASGEWQGEKYFLVVSRLVAYKKVDVAVKAFNQLGLPLKIVGVGREMRRLKKMARLNIKFLGQLTDSELLSYYQNCQAVIFPPEEDFGLVPLEAQSCGRPVIAFGAGGALETIIEGKTGLFFNRQTPEALAEAVEKFKSLKGLKSLRPEDCRQNAKRFSKDVFEEKIREFVEKEWKKRQKISIS